MPTSKVRTHNLLISITLFYMIKKTSLITHKELYNFHYKFKTVTRTQNTRAERPLNTKLNMQMQNVKCTAYNVCTLLYKAKLCKGM